MRSLRSLPQNSERSDEEAAKGKYATSMLPGSEMVYDRDTMAIKVCTEEVCPYGLHNRAERIVHQEVGEISNRRRGERAEVWVLR